MIEVKHLFFQWQPNNILSYSTLTYYFNLLPVNNNLLPS